MLLDPLMFIIFCVYLNLIFLICSLILKKIIKQSLNGLWPTVPTLKARRRTGKDGNKVVC